MCLIVIAWQARADLPLVVAANRDEWRERPTRAAHWWPDQSTIFAGRDLRAGGTWMGVTRAGRFAAVTNFRDPSDKRSTARSRGELVSGFLLSHESPGSFLAELHGRSAEYNGFNLIVGDNTGLWYYGSREGKGRAIPPGVHALSNHLLNEPWPKVVRARKVMEAAMLGGGDPAEPLFEMLADRQAASDDSLPDTGVGLAWERRLSTALITGEDYGTRASTVLQAGSGSIRVEERTLDAEGKVTGVVAETFAISA